MRISDIARSIKRAHVNFTNLFELMFALQFVEVKQFYDKMKMILRIFLVLFLILPCIHAEAFSSTAHLKLLVNAEKDMSKVLEGYFQEEMARLKNIESIIGSIATIPESTSDKLSFAGHPINAYHLVKRWYMLGVKAPNLNQSPGFRSHVNSRNLQMPSEADYIGAGAALLRLQRTYRLKTEDLAAGNVLGYMSQEPLMAEDMYLLGYTAMQNADYGLAAQWYHQATQSKDPNFPLADAYLQLAKAHKSIGDLVSAVEAADKADEAEPNNSTILAEKWSLRSQLESALKENYQPLQNMTTWERFLPDWKINYEALCRGENLPRPPEILKTLSCRYKRGLIPYVQYKEETLSWSPRISMFYDVISDTEADTIKQMATPLLYRAVVGDPAKAYATNERVSKVAWLWDTDATQQYFVKKLSLRVKDITGLETQYRPEFSSSEPFQVVNYGIGGQYEPHVDYYEDKVQLSNVPSFIHSTGDRLTTFLYYLSDIVHGGATVYPNIAVRVPPVKNAAAFWYNAKPSGEFDKDTQHAGCPVLLGEKWIANKWIREFGQEFRRPCLPDPNAIWDV